MLNRVAPDNKTHAPPKNRIIYAQKVISLNTIIPHKPATNSAICVKGNPMVKPNSESTAYTEHIFPNKRPILNKLYIHDGFIKLNHLYSINIPLLDPG